MDILSEIVTHKRIEVQRRKQAVRVETLKAAAQARPPPPAFSRSIALQAMGLIAEVKRRSPSVGQIREPFDPREVAMAYEYGGVQAISVLMDEKYFGGGEAAFQAVRAAVHVPLLYKEFVVDPWQVWHAASLGASAILLIAAILDRGEMKQLVDSCAAARLEPVVEVHNDVDLAKAASFSPRCIGINNRDLSTFTVSLQTSLRLAPKVPRNCTLISESGITSPDDVAMLKLAGVNAILVGEHLLRQKDVVIGIQNLMKSFWQ